jgi:hypothetical protein
MDNKIKENKPDGGKDFVVPVEIPAVHKEGQILLTAIKNHLPELDEIYKKCNTHWGSEDSFYRYYHGSFKVYWLQKTTEKILKKFQEIAKETSFEPLNKSFLQITNEGTGIVFDLTHNKEWDKNTRPILEAFFHSREMLKFMIKYGKELDSAPNCLPSGWAAVLYLYNIR